MANMYDTRMNTADADSLRDYVPPPIAEASKANPYNASGQFEANASYDPYRRTNVSDTQDYKETAKRIAQFRPNNQGRANEVYNSIMARSSNRPGTWNTGEAYDIKSAISAAQAERELSSRENAAFMNASNDAYGQAFHHHDTEGARQSQNYGNELSAYTNIAPVDLAAQKYAHEQAQARAAWRGDAPPLFDTPTVGRANYGLPAPGGAPSTHLSSKDYSANMAPATGSYGSSGLNGIADRGSNGGVANSTYNTGALPRSPTTSVAPSAATNPVPPQSVPPGAIMARIRMQEAIDQSVGNNRTSVLAQLGVTDSPENKARLNQALIARKLTDPATGLANTTDQTQMADVKNYMSLHDPALGIVPLRGRDTGVIPDNIVYMPGEKKGNLTRLGGSFVPRFLSDWFPNLMAERAQGFDYPFANPETGERYLVSNPTPEMIATAPKLSALQAIQQKIRQNAGTNGLGDPAGTQYKEAPLGYRGY